MARDDLETLAFDIDIGSDEGLSVDQMTRSRLQFLLGQSAQISRQTQFADAKAGTLLAIVGVLALIVADRQAGVHAYLLAAYAIVTVAVVAICLYALMPRVPSAKHADELSNSDLFSWPSLSSGSFDGVHYADIMRTSNASILVMSIARSNVAIARVLQNKYKLLRYALGLALVDLILLGCLLSPAVLPS